MKAVRPTTNKEARAEPLANAIAVGEVFLLKGRWNADFLEELRSFPGGKYKDQVDAAAGAYVAGLNPQVTRRKTIMAGLEPTQCASKGCERPAASGSHYCCDKCEGAAAFEDPELVKAIDHTHSCNARLGNLELSKSSIPTAAERRRELALAGMRR